MRSLYDYIMREPKILFSLVILGLFLLLIVLAIWPFGTLMAVLACIISLLVVLTFVNIYWACEIAVENYKNGKT